MARKVVFFAHAGTVGTDIAQGFIFDDDVTDEMLSDDAWQFALDHAESYSIYWSPNMVDEADQEEEEDGDQYSDSIEGWWGRLCA